MALCSSYAQHLCPACKQLLPSNLVLYMHMISGHLLENMPAPMMVADGCDHPFAVLTPSQVNAALPTSSLGSHLSWALCLAMWMQRPVQQVVTQGWGLATAAP
jgi:hypothetical protein